MMNSLLGSILILLSAAGFGAMALCARIAYADGVDTATLLTLRFVMATSVLWILAKTRKSIWPTGPACKIYLLMGAVYTAMAWTYFSALHHASSSTVALVLYIYPILVAAGAALLGMDRFGRPELLAVLASSLGLMLMLGTSLHSSLTGFVLAATSALCYAGYILLGSKIRGTGSPLAASCLVLASAGVIFSFISVLHGVRLPHTPTAWLAIGFLAIFGTAMSIAAFVAGLDRVGPTLAAILSTLEPVVTIGLGIAFLDESLQMNSLAGGTLIIGAAIGLTLARMRRTSAPIVQKSCLHGE